MAAVGIEDTIGGMIAVLAPNIIRALSIGMAIVLVMTIIGCKAGAMQSMPMMSHDEGDMSQCSSVFVADAVVSQKYMSALFGVTFLLLVVTVPAVLQAAVLQGRHFFYKTRRLQWRSWCSHFLERVLGVGLLRPKTY